MNLKTGYIFHGPNGRSRYSEEVWEREREKSKKPNFLVHSHISSSRNDSQSIRVNERKEKEKDIESSSSLWLSHFFLASSPEGERQTVKRRRRKRKREGEKTNWKCVPLHLFKTNSLDDHLNPFLPLFLLLRIVFFCTERIPLFSELLTQRVYFLFLLFIPLLFICSSYPFPLTTLTLSIQECFRSLCEQSEYSSARMLVASSLSPWSYPDYSKREERSFPTCLD